MTSISKMRVLALAVAVAVGSVVRAEAIPIVSISPATQTVPQGPVSVDILVSNLGQGEEVGSFSLLLSFNSAILSGVSFINDPDAKMGALANNPANDLSLGFSVGTLDLFYLADDFAPAGPGPEDDAALQALQGTGFRLATVNFMANADGQSLLTLSVVPPAGAFLSDALGFELPAAGRNGEVCVGGPCAQTAVPEPATFGLLGAGICALLVRRRRQAQSQSQA